MKKVLNVYFHFLHLRFYTSSENQDFKTCSGIADERLVQELPPDSDTPIQFLTKEFPLSYANGNQNPNDIMGQKDKKQYGNMGGNYGPFGPPIYQQPQLPSNPYSNGYGMNSFSNQLPYPASAYYPSNNDNGDGNVKQQMDPSSYAYSNGLAYYPSQGPEVVEAITLVQPSPSTTPATTVKGDKKKPG